MNNTIKKLSIFFFISFFCLLGYAQKTKKVSDTFTYGVPKDITLEQAENNAIQRAKIRAIEKEFSTAVHQTNLIRTENRNGEATTDFTSLGGSEVLAEWIEDIEKPVIKYSLDGNQVFITCTVKGRAREKVNTIVFNAKVLCNGTDKRFEQDKFKNGDQLYLSFQTPQDGYIAVYLINMAEKKATCLLPYRKDADGQTEVKHGQEYIFFSREHDSQSQTNSFIKKYSMVEEYHLHSTGNMELYQLCIIFSLNPFTKPADETGNDPNELPSLSLVKFERWLSDIRAWDTNMSVETKTIHVNK